MVKFQKMLLMILLQIINSVKGKTMNKRAFSSFQVSFSKDFSEDFLKRGKTVILKDRVSTNKDGGFETNPHVTILYGIHKSYPTPDSIYGIETHPRFPIRLGLISLFKGDEFDVVKVDVECQDLFALRSVFLNSCEYTLTQKEYIPHATIAYVKPGTHDHLDGHPLFRGMTDFAEKIFFSSIDRNDRYIPLGVK